MASPEDRVPQNVPGPFFVDAACIDCDTCRCIGPDHFARDEEEGYSYVCAQPTNEEEVDLMEEAMDCCPVDAIGCDGDAAEADEAVP